MSITPRASFSLDSKITNNKLPKSLLLRDYLLDDMSSCSSNGFLSYPRRQCCTTVRFLVEMDLNKNVKQQPRLIVESKTKQPSVLHRASAVMISAFKRFPFAGRSMKPTFLPRSISRKLLKQCFWKKSDRRSLEIKRFKSFGDLIKEEEITLPPSPSQFSTAVTTTTNDNSWSGSDFTATTDSFTGGDSSEVNLSRNDVVCVLPEIEKTTNGKGVGATTATATVVTNTSDATENAKWQGKHDEQSSPVSVMDFPSDNENDVDDEDAVSSGFQINHLDVGGTRKVMHKTRRFDGLPQLEPVKLENRIAQLVIVELNQEEHQLEKKALALLQLMKSTISSHCAPRYEVVESLLLDFFKEQMIQENVSNYEMLQAVKNWLDGQVQGILLDWESKNSKQIYLKGIEKEAKWSNYDFEVEKHNIGHEVECEIYNLLVNEVLLDFQL